MRNRVFIADLTIDENPAPHRITVNLGDETQTGRGRHRRLRNRPGQRRQRDFDRLTVKIRVGHLPAMAEVSKHLIGDVLRIDLYDSGGNRSRRGRIGDRRIQVSHRVHAIADDYDHTDDDRRQPQLAEYSAPASPLGPRAHTSISRPGMTYS